MFYFKIFVSFFLFFTQVGPKNAERPGGYTRILRLGFRPGDHARRAIIEFVDAGAVAQAVAG